MSIIYTIGHGNRRIEEFLELLAGARIDRLVDIRAYPGSRRYPQFRREALRASLENKGIDYQWMGDALGGRRTPLEDSPHVALAAGVRGFADHMRTSIFQTAVDELAALAQESKLAAMCAELAAERCHRSLLADYLVVRGNDVTHLLGHDARRVHRISAVARTTENGLIYDRYATLGLEL